MRFSDALPKAISLIESMPDLLHGEITLVPGQNPWSLRGLSAGRSASPG